MIIIEESKKKYLKVTEKCMRWSAVKTNITNVNLIHHKLAILNYSITSTNSWKKAEASNFEVYFFWLESDILWASLIGFIA